MRPALLHFQTILRSRRRLAVAGLMLIYATTAVGVPLPLVVGASKSGELFPCADCACGCATAEQCWRSCCFHTLAERIAWAHEHNVRPPDYALAAARTAGLNLAWLETTSAAKTATADRCDHDHGREREHAVATAIAKPLPTCCQRRLAIAPRAGQQSPHACCQQSHRSDGAQASAQSAGPNSGRTKICDRLVAWRAMECHGQSMKWLAATPTLVLESPTCQEPLPLIEWLGPAMSDVACRTTSLPTVPPPERA